MLNRSAALWDTQETSGAATSWMPGQTRTHRPLYECVKRLRWGLIKARLIPLDSPPPPTNTHTPLPPCSTFPNNPRWLFITSQGQERPSRSDYKHERKVRRRFQEKIEELQLNDCFFRTRSDVLIRGFNLFRRSEGQQTARAPNYRPNFELLLFGKEN